MDGIQKPQGPQVSTEPRSLYGISAAGMEFQRTDFPPHIKLLGELIADLAWHVASIKDRLNDAEIPQLEGDRG